MFSFPGLLSVVFFSGVAVIILKLVFRNNNAILYMDIRFLFICMLLILIRMFVPIESPIANNIPIYKIYPDIYIFIKESYFNIGGREFHLLDLFIFIWFVGFIITFVIMVNSYLYVKRQIDGFKKLEDSRIANMVAEIGKGFNRKIPFRLLTEDGIGTPFVFGILKPSIVIPKMELGDTEVYLILKHEMLHYYRGDTLIKLLCEILKSIYWWNPFAYMLGNLIANMQEINVDFNVIKGLSSVNQLDYSLCLINVARIKEYRRCEKRWLVSFQKESPSAVDKRIKLMMDNMDISRKKTMASIFLSAMILGLIVLCPNVLNFEPYSVSESDVGQSVGGREGGIWGVDNGDGTYDIYVEGIYLKTISKDEISDDNIKIYTNLENTK
ncbi:M56 family metallopeptidase [Lachnospiraceae bacterium]|nr:M56 family metallopeptidase [Lachnospiraceae bacterium]